MRIAYEYTFMDGMVLRLHRELTFNVLKRLIDFHHGLQKIKKIAEIIDSTIDEMEKKYE